MAAAPTDPKDCYDFSRPFFQACDVWLYLLLRGAVNISFNHKWYSLVAVSYDSKLIATNCSVSKSVGNNILSFESLLQQQKGYTKSMYKYRFPQNI